jgi:hypothetical protein
MASLLFAPLESSVSSSFWTELARLKLDELRLSERPLDVVGASAARVFFSRAAARSPRHVGAADTACCAGFLSSASRAELASPLHVEAASLQPVRHVLTSVRCTADSPRRAKAGCATAVDFPSLGRCSASTRATPLTRRTELR